MPSTKSGIYLAVIGVLLVVVAAFVYTFIVAGSTARGDDGRTAIVLAPGERALMLREMRDFVAGLQAITDALARGDMKAAAEAAAQRGTAKSRDVPLAMLGKLPLQFKSLAFGVQGRFDAIAADARAGGTPAHSLAQLSEVLGKCVACHASYQVTVAPPR